MISWDRLKKLVDSASGDTMARFTLPRVVYEIEPSFVLSARLDGRSKQLRRLAVRELEPHTLEPLAHRPNVVNAENLRVALRDLAQTVGNGNGPSGLLLPDGAVRVAILDFETLPENRKDAESLVRWRMRENLPAAPDETRLSYQVLSKESRRVELLVVAVRTAVLTEYEQILEPMNGGLALVLPATIAVLPLVPAGNGGGELLLHLCAGWMTAVVLHENRAKLWRCSELPFESPDDLARTAAVEAARVSESARDHLHIETERVWLAERPLSSPGLEDEISRTLSKEVVRLQPPGATGRALSETEHPVFENFGAAVAGLVLNVS
jgi:hypothetical protein